jgi:hypothetical protein
MEREKLTTITEALWNKYSRYKIRRCLSMHDCAVCEQDITLGQYYFDGGYGRRAHVDCVDPEGTATPAWEQLPNGKRRATWVKGHVCDEKCYGEERGVGGRIFSYCKRFSYRGD